MSDLAFHDTPIPTSGIKARLLAPVRRAVRKLMSPYFARLVEILEALRQGQFEGARERDALRWADARLIERDDQLGGRADGIDRRIDPLQATLDACNARISAVEEGFKTLRNRQDDLERELAAVIALNWDHVAASRRLARIEDRLIDLEDGPCKADRVVDEGETLRFPGLDRYEPEAI